MEKEEHECEIDMENVFFCFNIFKEIKYNKETKLIVVCHYVHGERISRNILFIPLNEEFKISNFNEFVYGVLDVSIKKIYEKKNYKVKEIKKFVFYDIGTFNEDQIKKYNKKEVYKKFKFY